MPKGGISMIKEQFNDNWLFKKGSIQSLQAQLRPSGDAGEVVHLPHDAMILEVRTDAVKSGVASGFYPGGDYTYTKKIQIPADWREKIITLEFEGVYNNAKIFINGALVTVSHNGYSNFYVDTTGYLIYGVENEIKVTVNNTAIPNSRWYSGSGIYRPVNLFVANMIHFGLNGVKLTTPQIEDDLAIVQIDAIVENKGRLNEKALVRTEIMDMDSEIVAVSEMPIGIISGNSTTLRQRILVEEPDLWNPETPNLYTATLQILTDEKVWDTETIQFGIRELKLDAKKGFRINGKSVKLRGACIHHDNGILGAATFEQAEERRVRQLKNAGFNAIRSSHHPISTALLNACDKHGVLVIDELSDMWTQAKNLNDYSEHFLRNWETDVEAMINKCFNHPSVIMYCMGNEIQELGSNHGAELNRKINHKIHELDATRFTTNGINGMLAAASRLPEIMMDIRSKMSANKPMQATSSGQASESGSNQLNSMMSLLKGPMADALATHPIMTEVIGEAASSMDVAGFNYMLGRHEIEGSRNNNRIVLGTETYPGDIAELWEVVKKNSHVIGDMTWTGYDYLGEAGIGVFHYDGKVPFADNWPDSVAYVGDIDITGYRRPVSYYREIVFGLRKAPYISVQRVDKYGMTASATPWHFKDSIASWTWDSYEGKPAVVDVFADADEVELFLNDNSLGRKVVGEHEAFIVTFELQYEPGTLKAVSYCGGVVEGVDVLKTADSDVNFDATIDKLQLSTDKNDLAYVEIQLVDSDGRPNRWAQREISIEAEGEVSIQGFGSADPQTDNYYYNHTWKTYDGRLLAVVRSSGNVGVGKVTLRMGDIKQVIKFIVEQV